MLPPSQTTTIRPVNSFSNASRNAAEYQGSKYSLTKVRANKPRRYRRGDSHRAPATETFSRLPPSWARAGVCPRGDQVRRTSGAINKPLSSIKAIEAPCRRAFFDVRPVGPQPRGDLRRVAFPRDALGLLECEAAVSQPCAQPSWIKVDAELLLDQLGQTRGTPQLGGEPVFQGIVAQPSQDDLLLGGGQFAGSALHGTSP